MILAAARIRRKAEDGPIFHNPLLINGLCAAWETCRGSQAYEQAICV
jgi:hypothetical protein